MTNPVLLDVRGISVRTGAVSIVDRVSFDLLPGETVALIGPNGSGKTTLMEAVVGLRRRQEGTVAHHGVAVTTLMRSRTTCSTSRW